MNSYRMETTRALDKLVVVSRAMSQTVAAALRLVDATEPVFVDGGPGTGKKLVARVLHEQSRRAHRPLVVMRSDALTVNALESLLFGDIHRGEGKLAEAEGGTFLLLDLEDLNPVAQERLLRVLEEGRYTTAAGETRVLDCRVVCTGDGAAIDEQIRLGRFSKELFFRLSVSTLHVPSLCERREDIPHLVMDILHDFARRERIEPPIVPYHYMELLMNVEWQENVRQLRNHVESVMTLSEGVFDPEIIREHFTPVSSPATIKGALESLLGRLRGHAARPAVVTAKR